MKKIVLTGIKKLEIIEASKPEISNDDEVLLKIDSVGICGSDLHYYNNGKIGDQVINFPFTVGHECSAKVEKVGKSVKRTKPGDIVSVEPSISCGKCQQCLSGRKHTCLNQKFLGCPGQIDGCLSEYIIMPEENCYPVPKNVNGESASLIEPLSIGYYTSQFIKSNGLKIIILGVGPIGLGVMLALQTKGFNEIYVTDKLNYRLDAARKAGAAWIGNPIEQNIISELKKINPGKFDIAIECCGQQEAIDQAIELLKPGGKLLIVGIPEVDVISFNISKLRRNEITIQNVRRQNDCIQSCIDLTSERRWSPEFMITHRFPVEKTNYAFEIVANYRDEVIKALIKF